MTYMVRRTCVNCLRDFKHRNDRPVQVCANCSAPKRVKEKKK